jgi:RNA polymerase sigma-70 factor (ECF subfamily)
VERELILQTKAGDGRAFGRLILINSHRAYRTAYRLLGNVEDASDLCQESFLRAYQNISGFDENRPFYPWLYRILKNLCLNFLKKKKRQPAVMKDPDSWDKIFATSIPGPAEQVLRNEDVERFWKALGSLSETHRSVLILKHFDNLSYAEMAEVLSVPIGTVMSRLYHARKHLGEIYDM